MSLLQREQIPLRAPGLEGSIPNKNLKMYREASLDIRVTFYIGLGLLNVHSSLYSGVVGGKKLCARRPSRITEDDLARLLCTLQGHAGAQPSSQAWTQKPLGLEKTKAACIQQLIYNLACKPNTIYEK